MSGGDAVTVVPGNDAQNVIAYFVGDPRTQRHERGLLPVGTSGDTLCVENIPKFVAPSEFLGHIASHRRYITHLRILGCSSNTAQYAVVIQFDSSSAADRVRSQYHRKPLSALGSEVLFIRYIDRDAWATQRLSTSSPPYPISTETLSTDAETDPSSAKSKPSDAKPRAPARAQKDDRDPAPGPPAPPVGDGAAVSDQKCPVVSLNLAIEKSMTCPVCLEDLLTPAKDPSSPLSDEYCVSGTSLWTTMCGHTGHLTCLQEYDGSKGCPVCRFNPADLGMECSELGCNEVEPLWMCLVCGHLGCGRYQHGHAEDHYRTTAHTYCLDVYTGSVWDYAGDGFVHRLVANSADGKLVESTYSRTGRTQETLDVEDAKFESQVEAVEDTYSRLLENQLGSVREYYVKLLDAEQARYDTHVAQLETTPLATQQCVADIREQVVGSKKAAAKSLKRARKSAQRASELAGELAGEEAVAAQLRSSLPKFKGKAAAASAPPPAHAQKRTFTLKEGCARRAAEEDRRPHDAARQLREAAALWGKNIRSMQTIRPAWTSSPDYCLTRPART
ncbi:BRCA1-associated protein-like protein 2 [Diplonema papillatum]|nr:BRCA1-associated protein-like protein 2 [Diplonema papillatum]